MVKIKKICKLLTATLFFNFFTLNVTTLADEIEMKTGTLTVSDYHEPFTTFKAENDYYAQKDGKTLVKDAIYKGICNLNTKINLNGLCQYLDNDPGVAANLFFDVISEHPDIFYCKKSVSYSYAHDYNGNLANCTLNVSYAYDNNTINKMKSELDNKVNSIINNLIKSSYSELQKEYIIHDYLTQNCTYDEENYKNGTIPDISHTAYGALIKQVAVCDGYSKANKLLLNKCGIECGVITSDAMCHAWNYVKIDNKYYQCDVTWDDPVPETNRISYSYFNLSNDEMGESHNWERDKYPVCTSNDFKFLRDKSATSKTRAEDKLYFAKDKNLYSSNLTGGNIEKIKSNFNGDNLIGNGNSIYFSSYVWFYPASQPTFTISKFNLANNSIEDVFKFDGHLRTLYIKNNNISAIYENGGNEKTKTVALPKDTVIEVNPKDVNHDGKVTILDLSMISTCYNASSTDKKFKSECDLNKDKFIDVYDMVQVSKAL
ncbi:MAG: dockerin type I domain-containing protein [Clostridium septicum]|uniref:dockerin type I domain-containing protein n=1 Tax=Clostridium septicum TaxID=1504 RepID=UPI00259017D1|nr:dockerin type I domain-containing protein [Clostridium septicum]MDU1314095.1 dockerin type I domain-containing protein [Clostridium septicum]